MMITADMIRSVLAEYEWRSEAIRMAGGIPLKDVVLDGKNKPDGWLFDEVTQYFYPPHLCLSRHNGNCQ